MVVYTGNAICDYISNNKLEYYFSVEHTWLLVYGNSASIPKILVFASKVEDVSNTPIGLEGREAYKAIDLLDGK